jgi:hypothetical protein
MPPVKLWHLSFNMTARPMFAFSMVVMLLSSAPEGQTGGHFMHNQHGTS